MVRGPGKPRTLVLVRVVSLVSYGSQSKTCACKVIVVAGFCKVVVVVVVAVFAVVVTIVAVVDVVVVVCAVVALIKLVVSYNN